MKKRKLRKKEKARRKTSKASLFNPDRIATAISQKLLFDLQSASQMYGGMRESNRYLVSAQREATLKKYVSPFARTDSLEQEAFASFLETNARIECFNESFQAPRDIQRRHLSGHELILVRARALMHQVLRDFSVDEFFSCCKNSAGVSKGVSFNDTSQEAKFTYPISTTSTVLPLFKSYLAHNNQLRVAIEDLNQPSVITEKYDVVEGSKATTVEKDLTKRRMIAIEPTLNMFFQQGLMRMMYVRMREFGLDVETLPDEHKDLAREGSITGNLATIDFSSASDSVSIELLRWLLPKKWFYYVDRVRSPVMEIAGETCELAMISTMGNAGTFPLESLVFWSLGVSAVMSRTRLNPNALLSTDVERETVSVFGDDCILPTADAPLFMEVCEQSGFLVNKEKTFFDPAVGFRESCGGDYLHGEDVRPFYLRAPASPRMSNLAPWLYTILNRIIPLYISYFGTRNYLYDKKLLDYIFEVFRENNLLVRIVPPYFPDDSGLNFTSDLSRFHACYGFKLHSVSCTDQGLHKFTYHKFQYRNQRPRDAHVRYALWLGKPVYFEPKLFSPIRRKGGYLVASGKSPSWTIPALSTES